MTVKSSVTAIAFDVQVLWYKRTSETLSKVNQNLHQRRAQQTSQYNTDLNRILSEQTVETIECEIVLETLIPLLTKHHRQILLHYSREHHDRTVDYMKIVSLSKETQFILQHVDVMLGTPSSGLTVTSLIKQVIHRSVLTILNFRELILRRLWDLWL